MNKISKNILFLLFLSLLVIGTSCEGVISDVVETDNSGIPEEVKLKELSTTVGLQWQKAKATNISNDKSSLTNFDYLEISDPVVIKNGKTYMMWYSGRNKDDIWSIAYATSTDGITWNREYYNIVLTPSLTGPDKDGVRVSSVIYEAASSTYNMWYRGLKKTANNYEYECNIFNASSDLPNAGWTKYPVSNNPESVLDLTGIYRSEKTGNPGWDRTEIGKCTVIKEDHISGSNDIISNYVMLYVDNLSPDINIYNPNVYFIASPSPGGFKGYKPPAQINIFRGVDIGLSFFSTGYCMPTVIKDSFNSTNIYKMWFMSSKGPNRKGGFAKTTQLNASRFITESIETPSIISQIDADALDIKNPCVIRDDNKYMMWYAGKNLANKYTICYKESTSN